MDNPLSTLFEKALKDIILWAKESLIRTFFILILFFVFLVPLIKYLQDLVSDFNYPGLFNYITNLLKKNLTSKDVFWFIVTALIFYLIGRLNKELLKTKIIREDFESGLNKWSIPLGSGWSIQTSKDVLGKMLNVTHSNHPGVLKDIFSWYDYEISFNVKIDEKIKKDFQKFAIVIRSENNFNGIMLQFSETEFRPHLLYNGTFILDKKNFEQLPTRLKDNDWIPMRIIVKGTVVEILIFSYKLIYKIPTAVYNIDPHILSTPTIELGDIEKNDAARKEKIDGVLKKYEAADKLPTEEREREREEALNILKDMPSPTRVLLEYQKGTIGFRESNSESAFFKNLIIKKL